MDTLYNYGIQKRHPSIGISIIEISISSTPSKWLSKINEVHEYIMQLQWQYSLFSQQHHWDLYHWKSSRNTLEKNYMLAYLEGVFGGSDLQEQAGQAVQRGTKDSPNDFWKSIIDHFKQQGHMRQWRKLPSLIWFKSISAHASILVIVIDPSNRLLLAYSI